MPALLVLVVQVVPRSTSRTMTVAFGMAEPLGSRTVPVIEPAACWAHAGDDAPNTNMPIQMDSTIINEESLFSFTGISLCDADCA